MALRYQSLSIHWPAACSFPIGTSTHPAAEKDRTRKESFRAQVSLVATSYRHPNFGGTMDKGLAFLKSQVNNAVTQHASFLGALATHEDHADDPRFSALCSRHLSNMREHQRMLEEYQSQLGGEPPIAKTEIGTTVAVVRD